MNFKCFAIDHRSVRENTNTSSLVKFFHPDLPDQSWSATLGKYGADYGELRALESFSKSDLQFGAIFHYRRVLLLKEPSEPSQLRETWEGKFLPYWNWSNSPEYGWTHDEIDEIVGLDYIVIPKAVNVEFDGHSNLYAQFLPSHPKKILDLVEEHWSEGAEFIDFLKQENELIPYNMAVLSRKDAVELCNWLFPILNSLEIHLIDLSADKYDKRWPGFLAERLTTYYWKKKIDSGRILHRSVGRLDQALELDFFLPASDSNIAFTGFDENYILPAFAMIETFASKTNKVLDFVCLTNISESTFSDFKEISMAKFPNLRIHQAKIDYDSEKIPWKIEGNWPIAALYRFLGPILTNSDRLVWIDGDVVCLRNPDELWEYWDADSSCYAAIDLFATLLRYVSMPSTILKGESWENYYSRILPRSKHSLVFQAGILVINVSYWLSRNAPSKLLQLAATSSYPGGYDQDLANIFFDSNISKLPQTFNYVNQTPSEVKAWSRKFNAIENEIVTDWLNTRNPVILHFTGHLMPKPFNSIEMHHPKFLHYWAEISKTSYLAPLMLKCSSFATNFSSITKKSKVTPQSLLHLPAGIKTKIFRMAFKLYQLIPIRYRNTRIVAKGKNLAKTLVAK